MKQQTDFIKRSDHQDAEFSEVNPRVQQNEPVQSILQRDEKEKKLKHFFLIILSVKKN